MVTVVYGYFFTFIDLIITRINFPPDSTLVIVIDAPRPTETAQVTDQSCDRKNEIACLSVMHR